MEYRSAVAYLESLGNLERGGAPAIAAAHFDLRRVAALLQALGDPHMRPSIVHIAGTKGKGSTAALLASMLSAAGLRTALYTSPHLHTVRERFQIDGALITPEAFAAQAAALAPAIGAVNGEARFGSLTTFEAWTALAFRYFAQEQVEVEVLETGLGGRLDATNVAPSQLCLLTSISLDHTQVLGETVGAIAREKAGIIKPGATVITAPQPPEALKVIEAACAEVGAARLVRVGEELQWARESWDLEGQSFLVHGLHGDHRLWTPLLGPHQGENLTLAVAAAELLAERGLPVSAIALVEGARSVRWPGRLEVLRRQPLVVADGAHNPYSAQVLATALRELPHERGHLIFGASPDKDLAGMAAALAPLFHSITVTQARGPRAAEPERLADLFRELGRTATVAPEVRIALERALQQAEPHDLMCVTGSLFLVGEARAALLGLAEEE